MPQALITDTRLYVETPEGADLPLDPAGVGVRAVAYLIDFIIRAAIIFGIGMAIGIAGKFGEGLFLILLFLIEWFYPIYFEVWKNGATPGKKQTGIMVVNEDGTPVNFSGSLIRNLLRVVDSFPALLYMTGIISCMCSSKFQRLGDHAAGTIVVYAQPERVRPEIDIKGKYPVPADFTTDEQRALMAFAERSKSLSLDRQRELADVLKPLITEEDTIKTIKQMANTLSGIAGTKQ